MGEAADDGIAGFVGKSMRVPTVSPSPFVVFPAMGDGMDGGNGSTAGFVDSGGQGNELL